MLSVLPFLLEHLLRMPTVLLSLALVLSTTEEKLLALLTFHHSKPFTLMNINAKKKT